MDRFCNNIPQEQPRSRLRGGLLTTLCEVSHRHTWNKRYYTIDKVDRSPCVQHISKASVESAKGDELRALRTTKCSTCHFPVSSCCSLYLMSRVWVVLVVLLVHLCNIKLAAWIPNPVAPAAAIVTSGQVLMCPSLMVATCALSINF